MEKASLGIVGLGVMGRNLLWNFADRGFRVAGLDTDAEKVAAALAPRSPHVSAFTDATEFLTELSSPRNILLLVPAGAPVDAAIEELGPRLTKGDLLVDGGNSHFRDTAARERRLEEKGLLFFGLGISGGAKGARTGPSLMPGGSEAAYARVRPALEAVAARVENEPCLGHLGTGAAGHFVKMVHNGIEYGLMQLIAETYDLLRRGQGLAVETVATLFAEWNAGALEGFLMETSARVLRKQDDLAPGVLIDKIQDAAHQKGTGLWASAEARQLHVPVPTLDVAVTWRDLSTERRLRAELAVPKKMAACPVPALREALHLASWLTYVQGFSLLTRGSRHYGFGLDLEKVARVWRGGCIIRSRELVAIARSFHQDPKQETLLSDPLLREEAIRLRPSLGDVVAAGAHSGISLPAHAASLFYWDSFTDDRLPLCLVQAQRDCFGAHGYERTDRDGTFHTDWEAS